MPQCPYVLTVLCPCHCAAGFNEKVKLRGDSGQVDVPVVAFEPYLPNIRMLVIPVVAADPQGNRCPGVQPYSFTLQVGGAGSAQCSKRLSRHVVQPVGNCRRSVAVLLLQGSVDPLSPISLA